MLIVPHIFLSISFFFIGLPNNYIRSSYLLNVHIPITFFLLIFNISVYLSHIYQNTAFNSHYVELVRHISSCLLLIETIRNRNKWYKLYNDLISHLNWYDWMILQKKAKYLAILGGILILLQAVVGIISEEKKKDCGKLFQPSYLYISKANEHTIFWALFPLPFSLIRFQFLP